MSICLPSRMPARLCLSVCLSVCLSIYLSICLSVHLSSHLSIYPSIRLSVYPSIYLSIRRSICLSICLTGSAKQLPNQPLHRHSQLNLQPFSGFRVWGGPRGPWPEPIYSIQYLRIYYIINIYIYTINIYIYIWYPPPPGTYLLPVLAVLYSETSTWWLLLGVANKQTCT